MINYIATNPGIKAFLSNNVVKSTFSAITHDYCSFTVVMFFLFYKKFFCITCKHIKRVDHAYIKL